MDWLPSWLDWNDVLWAVGVFLATLIFSVAAVVALIVFMPTRFLLDSHDRRFWVDRHPVIRWSGVIAKNLLGVLLVLAGLGLSLPGIPGQGLLTILIGVILLDFPGKRRLERKCIGHPRILRTVNGIRARFHRPPLVLDEDREE